MGVSCRVVWRREKTVRDVETVDGLVPLPEGVPFVFWGFWCNRLGLWGTRLGRGFGKVLTIDTYAPSYCMQ